MSSPPAASSVARNVEEDRRYIALHVGQKVLQIGSVLSPPLYTARQVLGGGWARVSLAGLLKTNAFVVYVVAPAGALLGLGRVMVEPWWYARHKALRLRTHEPVARADRCSAFGFAIGAIASAFVPRARAGSVVYRVPGGASLGAAAGFLFAKSFGRFVG